VNAYLPAFLSKGETRVSPAIPAPTISTVCFISAPNLTKRGKCLRTKLGIALWSISAALARGFEMPQQDSCQALGLLDEADDGARRLAAQSSGRRLGADSYSQPLGPNRPAKPATRVIIAY
jgi:hypothetical protein